MAEPTEVPPNFKTLIKVGLVLSSFSGGLKGIQFNRKLQFYEKILYFGNFVRETIPQSAVIAK